MDAHTISKMNRDPAAGPSFTGHNTHRRPGDDHHHRQSSATRLSPPRRQSPKPRDPRDRERDRIRDSSERDQDRERERGRDREWGKKESGAASVSRNRDCDDRDDDTGASDASNAETIVLPGKDGYSPSKVRKVRHERDTDDHDSHAHSSPQIPTSKLPPRIPTGPRASLSGSNPHSNAASEGPTRGILAKKNKIVDKSAYIARASSSHNSAANVNHNPNNSIALAGPTPIPNGGSPPPAVVKRRRQSSIAASSSAPPQSASHAGSDSESESHLKAKEKLAKSSNPSSSSFSSDKSLHKRKIIKCESDDEGEIPHKARRSRVSDNAQQPSAPPRSIKDSRPPKPEIPPPHSAVNSPALSTRSLSPTSKGLHRRSQSTNGPVIKKRRTPALTIHASDYNSDHASDDETPQTSTKPAAARGVAERTEPSTTKGPSKKNLDAHGQTLLARACAKGEYEAVKLRLQERPEDLNVADYAGNTPLQIAAINGCADIVALLLEKGCNKHCLNYDKETPLLDAVDNGHVDVVRLLLDSGVNPRKANGQGEEPLARVIHETPNGPEIRELLIKAKATYRRNSEEPHTDDAAYQSEGTSVADSGHSRQTSINYDLVHVTSGSSRRQISARANKTSNRLLYIEANDKTLVSACSKGDKEMVNHLLNMSQKYRFSEAITAAARGGYDDIVDILLGWGAPADPKPIKNGPSETATPILASIGQDNVKIMKLLLGQTSFDPTRHVKGKKYFEIARERQGRNWKEEEAILKRAYDNFKAKNPEQAAANEREGLAQTPSSSFDSLAIKTVGPSNKRLTSPGPSTSVDADDRKKSTSSTAATTTATTLLRDPESRDEKKTQDSLDFRRSADGRRKESYDSGSSNAPVTSFVSQKIKKRDKEKDKEHDQDFKASDSEAFLATAAAAATKKKVKRPVDSDAPVSSDGETSKPRRKLVSKGEMSQEYEAQRVRRMSMASNASSLNQPSSPRDPDDAPPRSSKGEISERYHDRAKALKRDESHSGYDNPTPSAKRHRSSTSPSGARSESDREKVCEEAETANTSKRRRLDSETLAKDGRLEVPRKRVDKGSDSEKGSSVDKESRPSKQSSSARESTPVSKPAKVHKEVRESTPQSGAHLKLSDQLRLKKQQKTKAAKTLSVHDSDVEMKDITVDNSYSRKEHSASAAGPDKKSRDTSETPQPKARRKLDENADHESRKSMTESAEKEEREIELAKRREAEKERWFVEEKEKERIREEREAERKAEADRIVVERQEREYEERKRNAEEEAQRVREEAKAQAELEERRKAEAEAKRKAEQEAKRKAEAERRAAEEVRLKAEEEARQRRLVEEKAAEEARLKTEAEKRRQLELQEQREREREAEERRQREIREQAEREEAERAERAERERERVAKEKQEQEQARIERLPAVLRWLETSADPQRPSFAEKFRVMQGVRWDTMDVAKDGMEEGREQWVLNTQVALLLGDKDLSLSKYPSWQRIPASHIAKISIWRVENDRYSLSSPRYSELGRELDGYYNAQNDLASVCQERLNRMKSEAEERFLAMDLFFVKVSDFLAIVPSIPHLKDLKLSVEYRELPDCKEKLKGIWCGTKWRSDPDADKYKGFAPGRRYFVNGVVVVGDFL